MKDNIFLLTVTIIGPNGNGWYEPIIENNQWKLNVITHHLNKRTPLNVGYLEDLVKFCAVKFNNNYHINIDPYRE